MMLINRIKSYKPIIIVFGFLFSLILFPSNLKSILIIVSGLIILYSFIKKKNVFRKKHFFLNIALFLMLFATLIYSENILFASKKLQTMSSLIVFPLLFSLINHDDKIQLYKTKNNFLWIYIVSVLLFNIIPFFWFYITNYSFSGILHHFKNIIIVDFGKYTIHPIYLSMHCCISILFSIHLFIKTETKSKKIFLIFLSIILVFFLLVYSRKGPIISLFVSLFIWSFLERKKLFKFNLSIIFGFIILLAIIPTTRDRFLELINVENASTNNQTSTNIRFTILKKTTKLIKESPFLGYGIGDYNDEIRKTFNKNELFLNDKKYNSHNQYLSFALIGGVPLLLFFLYFYYKNISLSFNQNNVLSILLLSFYGIMMFFENILERENGVIFFSFFINFFAMKNYLKIEE